MLCINAACNSSDGERFSTQEDAYTFESTSSKLIAYGASQIEDDSLDVFRCPAVSEMSGENNLTVFNAQANAPFPHFTLETIQGIRGDTDGAIGISLHNLQTTLFDLYERCNSTSYERLSTTCEGGTVVESCSEASGEGKFCEQIYEGMYQLVISAEMLDDENCFAEEVDRSPYTSSVPSAAYACDAFSPIPLAAAFRGNPPLKILTTKYNNGTPETTMNACCDISDTGGSFDFCFKPCGCRKLTVKIVPKSEVLVPSPDGNQNSDVLFDNTLRIAVFSNVENQKGKLFDLLESILDKDTANILANVNGVDALSNMFELMFEKGVDVIISMGNLTKDGSASQFKAMRELIDDEFVVADGSLCLDETDLSDAFTPEEVEEINVNCCSVIENNVCCSDKRTRVFDNICNAVFYKKSFLASLGEDEFNGSGLDEFTALFGPSNSASTIGKVQLVVLDTADASIASGQRAWLQKVLDSPEHAKCNIPAPTLYAEWPTLAECRSILGRSAGENVTCRECIQTEAYCIPPDAGRSDYTLGPENCVCVPESSKICRNNFTCQKMDGTDSTCICTRDEDCGNGGTCGEDGMCIQPIRLVFSYTPLFDRYGSRGNAFTSKDSAASLLSALIKANVSAVFSGRSHEFSSYSMGGIPMYITGGGGGEMASFSDKKNHWLYVEIPNAYTNPNPDDISIEVVEF
ncbi:MAG: hypothetical protein J6A01_09875 [Proteobacteria bacterium]|nr:hypothetical protein [Pseudomonadota bacterium]